MRIYRRKEFLRLPEGTVYAKGKPWYFGALSIKHDTTDYGDWWSLDPCWISANDSSEAVDRLEAMLEEGASHPMEDSIGRDGLIQEEDALFLVFEKDDLLKLREMIDKAISL
jgi:hypothetical protein